MLQNTPGATSTHSPAPYSTLNTGGEREEGDPHPTQFLKCFLSLPPPGRGLMDMGCSILTNHPVPSLGFRVNALSSHLLKPRFSLGRTPQHPPSAPPHLGGAVGAFQPRGPHPASSGEETMGRLTPHLTPHLGDPGHPKPVGGHHISLSPPWGWGGHTPGGVLPAYLPMERMVTSLGRPAGLGTLVAPSGGRSSGHLWLQRAHGAGPCTVWRCCWCQQERGN